MSNNSLNASTLTSSNNNIAVKADMASIMVSAIIFFAGVAAFSGSFMFDVNHEEWSMLFLLLGLAGISIGIIRLFANSKMNVYEPTGSRLKKSHYYFKQADLGQLLAAIDSNFGKNADALRCDDHGTVRMDVIASADGNFAAMQAFAYENNVYAAQNGVKVLSGDAAQSLVASLNRRFK